jgi:octaprenyl-diphosphate synthase
VVQQALAAYGKHLGTTFQLIDDVLDYRSDPASRGKNLGEDLAEGKPTLPLIHALRNAGAGDAELIRFAITQGSEQPLSKSDLARIMACIDATGGIDYTRDRALAEARAAEAALAPVAPSPWRDALSALAELTVTRER